MIQSYQTLHQRGYAHSVEIWDSERQLVGGLYGIAINGAFCGESMFHLKTDASKTALWALVSQMRRFDLKFIDCQMVNPHLATLGCVEVPRLTFLDLWQQALQKEGIQECWASQELSFE